MIDKKYKEGAKVLRNEYIGLNKKLQFHQKEFNDMQQVLQNYIKEFMDYEENLKTNPLDANIDDIKKNIELKLTNLEKELNAITSKINPISSRISKMKKEEEQLFNQIKEKYPSILDEDIINEIQSYLDM